MNHSTSKPTRAEQKYLRAIHDMPCIACTVDNLSPPCGPTEGHHMLSGNKRRGHMFVLPLGLYHHRGVPALGVDVKDMRRIYGPSLALESKAFREHFGNEDLLLELVKGKLP